MSYDDRVVYCTRLLLSVCVCVTGNVHNHNQASCNAQITPHTHAARALDMSSPNTTLALSEAMEPCTWSNLSERARRNLMLRCLVHIIKENTSADKHATLDAVCKHEEEEENPTIEFELRLQLCKIVGANVVRDAFAEMSKRFARSTEEMRKANNDTPNEDPTSSEHTVTIMLDFHTFLPRLIRICKDAAAEPSTAESRAARMPFRYDRRPSASALDDFLTVWFDRYLLATINHIKGLDRVADVSSVLDTLCDELHRQGMNDLEFLLATTAIALVECNQTTMQYPELGRDCRDHKKNALFLFVMADVFAGTHQRLMRQLHLAFNLSAYAHLVYMDIVDAATTDVRRARGVRRKMFDAIKAFADEGRSWLPAPWMDLLDDGACVFAHTAPGRLACDEMKSLFDICFPDQAAPNIFRVFMQSNFAIPFTLPGVAHANVWESDLPGSVALHMLSTDVCGVVHSYDALLYYARSLLGDERQLGQRIKLQRRLCMILIYIGYNFQFNVVNATPLEDSMEFMEYMKGNCISERRVAVNHDEAERWVGGMREIFVYITHHCPSGFVRLLEGDVLSRGSYVAYYENVLLHMGALYPTRETLHMLQASTWVHKPRIAQLVDDIRHTLFGSHMAAADIEVSLVLDDSPNTPPPASSAAAARRRRRKRNQKSRRAKVDDDDVHEQGEHVHSDTTEENVVVDDQVDGQRDEAAPTIPITTPAISDNQDQEACDDESASLRHKLEDMLCCPITHEIMHDPVILSDGFTYERRAIEAWLARDTTSPMTGAVMADRTITPNHMVRTMIAQLHPHR